MENYDNTVWLLNQNSNNTNIFVRIYSSYSYIILMDEIERKGFKFHPYFTYSDL